MKLLGIHKFVSADISKDFDLGASMREIKRVHTNLEVRHTSDKASGGIKTLPNEAKMLELYDTWWNAYKTNRVEAHSGLNNM